MPRQRARESGQVAVETALTMPMLLFALLGMLQVTMAAHARLFAEHAAFKAARAASVYRLDCVHMTRAALVALTPVLRNPAGTNCSGSGPACIRKNLAATVQRVTGKNGNRIVNNVPEVLVDYRLTGRRTPFDQMLEAGEEPMRVHVRLTLLYEYRIPFANWILTRSWLAAMGGISRWAQMDPTLPMKQANELPVSSWADHELVTLVALAHQRNIFTAPITASWSMRMMSDPLPNAPNEQRCRD